MTSDDADQTPAGTAILLHGFAGVPIMNRLLARKLSRTGYDTHELGYDSWGKSLGEVCDRLLPRIARIAENNPGPVHFVGHSMGGLVIRALLQRERPAQLGHVVMLGTPNAGSEVADFCDEWAVLRPILGKAAPALVTRRSAAVDALFGPVDYSLGVVAGDWRAPVQALSRLIPGPNDGKVSVASTRLAEATDHIVLPLSHTLLLYHAEAHRQVGHFLAHGRFDPQPRRRRSLWQQEDAA